MDGQYNVFCESRTARISQCVWSSFDQTKHDSDSVLDTKKHNKILGDDDKYINNLLEPHFDKRSKLKRERAHISTVV